MTSPSSAPQRPAEHVHTVQPPPEQDSTIAAVAEVLATGAGIYALAVGISALLPHLDRRAIMAALGLANRGTAHTPRTRLKVNGVQHGTAAADATRAASRRELYFRAAYVVNAATRIMAERDAGKSLGEALAAEAKLAKAHELARRRRVDAAAKVARAAGSFGDLLGWYRDPESNSEADCLAADGNNFHASRGTVIGLPGTVHLHCRCEAGPPHEGAGMVDDAVRGVVRLVTRVRPAAASRRTRTA